LLLVLCSCDRLSKKNDAGQKQPEEAPSFRALSATELFDLQSRCTLMGEKIMQESHIGTAMTQQQVIQKLAALQSSWSIQRRA